MKATIATIAFFSIIGILGSLLRGEPFYAGELPISEQASGYLLKAGVCYFVLMVWAGFNHIFSGKTR